MNRNLRDGRCSAWRRRGMVNDLWRVLSKVDRPRAIDRWIDYFGDRVRSRCPARLA